MNIVRLLLLAVFIFSGTPSFAADVKLNPGFLGGKWSTEGKQGCGSATTQYVILHANGTMEVGRGDTPMSVGFWSVRDNVITLHLLVAPRESDTTNVFYQGKYHYSYLSVNVLETRQDAFDVVTGTVVDMARQTLTKCD